MVLTHSFEQQKDTNGSRGIRVDDWIKGGWISVQHIAIIPNAKKMIINFQC